MTDFSNFRLVRLGGGRSIELALLLNANGEQAFFVEKMVRLRAAQGQPAAQGLIGRAPAFQHMLALVARVAPAQATVLLLGESGTGKELVAQAIHAASPRAHRPLVAVDCASLPENLLESELFGHERGAFTGASTARGGLIEAASAGTLFLDEGGDIPLSMQVKLLRLLETGTYRRVGSTELRHADIRVVYATHRNQGRMVALELFREDLYCRLGTFPVHLPALRERWDDIALLASALLERVAPQRKLRISESALRLLQAHDYPGNVWELRNLLERTALLCDGNAADASHVQKALSSGRRPLAESRVHPETGDADTTDTASIADTAATRLKGLTPAPGAFRAIERAALQQWVNSHHGSRADLASKLGIGERSLYCKRKALE